MHPRRTAAGRQHMQCPRTEPTCAGLVGLYHHRDLDESIARCSRLGGKLRRAVESMGNMGRFCVIEDPAGAVCALFEPSKDA